MKFIKLQKIDRQGASEGIVFVQVSNISLIGTHEKKTYVELHGVRSFYVLETPNKIMAMIAGGDQ